MANRHTLHFKHLEPFKNWLIENDWEIKPLSNSKYEVLRAKRDCEWVIVYKKDDAKEHYSLSDKAGVWVNRWIRETQIRQDERMKVIEEIKSKVKELIDSKDFKLCNHEYANGFYFGLQYDLAKLLDQVERSEKDEKHND